MLFQKISVVRFEDFFDDLSWLTTVDEFVEVVVVAFYAIQRDVVLEVARVECWRDVDHLVVLGWLVVPAVTPISD